MNRRHPMRTLELKIPPVVTGLCLGAVMFALSRSIPILAFTLPAGPVLAPGLAVAGVVVAVLGVASFRQAGTTVNPRQPATTSSLVIAGIYRLTRNPMYLGMLLVLLGWGLFLGHALALVVAVAFVPLMNRLQIAPEEKILTERFGPEYTAYLTTVRRWL